jgi:hypothetical protein
MVSISHTLGLIYMVTRPLTLRLLDLDLMLGGRRRVIVVLPDRGYPSRRPQMARQTLHWDRPFHTVRAGGFQTGDIAWFPEGALNASYNCVDRWAYKNPNKVCPW